MGHENVQIVWDKDKSGNLLILHDDTVMAIRTLSHLDVWAEDAKLEVEGVLLEPGRYYDAVIQSIEGESAFEIVGVKS